MGNRSGLADDRKTPLGESSSEGFRSRTQERLAGERGDNAPPNKDDRDRNSDAHQSDKNHLEEPEGYPGESLDHDDDEQDQDPNRFQDEEFEDEDDNSELTNEDDDEPGVDEDPNAEGEDDDLSDEVRSWKAKAEEAEERADNMLSDYTRKTQGLSKVMHVLEPIVEINRAVKQGYLDQAKQYLDQHEGQDWQKLQMTLPPAEYQKRVKAREQAIGLYQRAKQQNDDYYNAAEKNLLDAKKERSRLSGDILKASIPGWGKEMYHDLGLFAVDSLGMSADAFGNIDDHVVLELIHFKMKSENPGRSVLNEKRKGNKRRPRRRNKEQTSRGEGGKFRNLEKHRRENPGDKGANRESFRMRLQKERKTRR